MVATRTNNNPAALASAKASLQHLARDHARVPISWSDSPNAGFSSVKPWMRALDDTAICNAKQQQSDKTSVLAFWKHMLAIRKRYNDLLVHGDFDILEMEDKDLFMFTKTWRGRKALVVCNFTKKRKVWKAPREIGNVELLVSTLEGIGEAELKAYEGRIYLPA